MKTGKIRFFRFFHKGVLEAPVREVEFRFDRASLWGLSELVCLYGGERSTISLDEMYPLAAVLPEGVEIKYAEGFWGRLARKRCEKWKLDHIS